MNALPSHVSAYQRTPEFSEDTVPAGLLKSHNTKAGVWGKIVVLEGALSYTILEPDLEVVELTPAIPGIVEPTVKHEVQAVGRVRFYVEFYR